MRVSPQDYIYNLEKMADFIRKNNIKIVFISPMLYENSTDFPLGEYHLPENNAKVNLLTRFKQEDKLEELFFDNCHLTSKGHQIVAEEIANVLIKEGIVTGK